VISSDGWRVMDIVNLACFLITFVMRCAHGRAEERRPSSCRVVGAIGGSSTEICLCKAHASAWD
jgi:hypothetical protein